MFVAAIILYLTDAIFYDGKLSAGSVDLVERIAHGR
jgi:hypothetical protein